MENTSRHPMPLPPEAPLRRELTTRPLLETAPAVARFPIPEGGQQELTEFPGLPEFLDRARRHAEHPRDMRDGADGWELVADLERAIRNVERARTVLRLHTLALHDLLTHD